MSRQPMQRHEIALLLFIAAWMAGVLIWTAANPRTASTSSEIVLTAAEAAPLEAQAAALCKRHRATRSGYIALPDGVLVCTRDRGRNPETTTAWRDQP